MKMELLFKALLCGLLYLGACAQTLERVGPQGVQGSFDPYFRPKRVYAVDVNQAWDLTLKALNQEGISLETVNREAGLMRTDYQNISAWERTQCEILFSPEPQEKTFIYIRCRYEGRKEAIDPFRDLTHSSPREVMKTEEGVYRKIEPYILPFERNHIAREEPMAKSPTDPAQPLAVATPLSKPEAISPPAPSAPTTAQPRLEVSPPPRVDPPSPQPSVPPLQPFPVMTKKKPEPMATPPVKETPSPKPREPAVPGPPAVGTGKKPGIAEESISYPATIEAANVRLAPSTQSKIVAVLGKGEKVEKVGESGLWTKIKMPSGDTAWIFTAFLKEFSPREMGLPVKPSPSRELSPMPITSNAKTPPIQPEVTSPPPTRKAGETVNQKTVKGPPKLVTTVNVKMRAEPSPTAKVVLILKKGRGVEKIGASGGFTKVRLSWGDTGWVPNRYLKKDP